MTKFPGQDLVDAANFILERREAGDKTTIPIWRGLPDGEAEAAEHTVLVPFVSDNEDRPAVIICPEWENGRAENDGGRSENSRYVFGIRVSGIYSE